MSDFIEVLSEDLDSSPLRVEVHPVHMGSAGYGVQVDILNARPGYGAILTPSQAREVADALIEYAIEVENAEEGTQIG